MIDGRLFCYHGNTIESTVSSITRAPVLNVSKAKTRCFMNIHKSSLLHRLLSSSVSLNQIYLIPYILTLSLSCIFYYLLNCFLLVFEALAIYHSKNLNDEYSFKYHQNAHFIITILRHTCLSIVLLLRYDVTDSDTRRPNGLCHRVLS
jgi:hypothetical protein